MPIKFEINMDSIKKKVINNAMKPVEEITQLVYFDLILFSPIDTWKYVSQHRNKWVRKEWNRIIWEIENVWEYPERLEKWFKKTPVKWHLRNLWQIYYSKWANVYAKAIAKNKPIFIKKLTW